MLDQDDGEQHEELDQVAEFKEKYGYDWPNCAVPDCEYKSCVPFENCYPHLAAADRIEADRQREMPWDDFIRAYGRKGE